MFNTQRIWWWLQDQRSKCCPLETEFISNTLNRLMNHSWNRAEKHYLATESYNCFIIKGNLLCNIDNNKPRCRNHWPVKCIPLIVPPRSCYADFHIKKWRCRSCTPSHGNTNHSIMDMAPQQDSVPCDTAKSDAKYPISQSDPGRPHFVTHRSPTPPTLWCQTPVSMRHQCHTRRPNHGSDLLHRTSVPDTKKTLKKSSRCCVFFCFFYLNLARESYILSQFWISVTKHITPRMQNALKMFAQTL